jgi:hypothetical protein
VARKSLTPQAHPLRPCVEIISRGYHGDWNLRGRGIVLECAADREAVEVGHHQVEPNDINRLFERDSQALGPGESRRSLS